MCNNSPIEIKQSYAWVQIRRPIREHSTKTLNQTLKSICIIIQGEFDTKSVLMGHIVLCDFHASAVLIRDEQTSENK